MFVIIETYAPDVLYMVIVKKDADVVHRELLKRNINYMGQELLFETEDSQLCSPEYLEQLRKDNILSWANAIVYSYKAVLAAGHSDDTALSEDMEKGWGWLARRGFDFFLTDWPIMVKMYLEQQGLLYR